MNWEVLRENLGIVQWLITGIIGVYSWWVARNRATHQAIRAVDERVTQTEQRILVVEGDMRHVPTQADLQTLSTRIEALHGDVKELSGVISGLRRAVDLMNQHLIEHDR